MEDDHARIPFNLKALVYVYDDWIDDREGMLLKSEFRFRSRMDHGLDSYLKDRVIGVEKTDEKPVDFLLDAGDGNPHNRLISPYYWPKIVSEYLGEGSDFDDSFEECIKKHAAEIIRGTKREYDALEERGKIKAAQYTSRE
jgi:hypothetical protein